MHVPLIVQKSIGSQGVPSPWATGVHVPLRQAHPWQLSGSQPVHIDMSGSEVVMHAPPMQRPGEHGSSLTSWHIDMSGTFIAVHPVPSTHVPVVHAESRKLQSIGVLRSGAHMPAEQFPPE